MDFPSEWSDINDFTRPFHVHISAFLLISIYILLILERSDKKVICPEKSYMATGPTVSQGRRGRMVGGFT
jgi:hypothetical protein